MRLFTALPTINDLAASCRYPGSLQDDEKILARVLKIRIRVLGETHLSRVDYAYAEGPRGIQQVRYRKESSSKRKPKGNGRTPCPAL
jgi:hypothetical protein